MDVVLYVYDLSQGLARQMSGQFLGTQIDAVYHTSIVLEGIEYFFGQGIQTCQAGTTHHGRPMEVIKLGRTELPMELILDYLDSLKQVYTAESYDLFLHNCNNFSNDFSMFLVGKNIPDHITTLPQTVLNTPFGQMLRPYLDQSMRSITQAPIPAPSQALPSSHLAVAKGRVQNIRQLSELDTTLASARQKFAVIFFTSSTCAPCKVLYPTYDELAAEVGDRGVLIKVDINYAHDIAMRYSISATPTIMTFLKGEKQEQWAGADVNRLKSAVQILMDIARPRHSHSKYPSSALAESAKSPIRYSKVPPLDKLVPKLGSTADDPIVKPMCDFIRALNSPQKQENPLPSLPGFGTFLQNCFIAVPLDSLFAAYDLLRVALSDVRVSGFFLEPQNKTVPTLISHVTSLGEKAPYNLRIVTLQMACNLLSNDMAKYVLFSSSSLVSDLVNLVTSNLLDTTHLPARVAAASLAFNLAALNYKHRTLSASLEDGLPGDAQLELVAALIEAFGNEDGTEALTGLTMALALFVHLAPLDGEVIELGRMMNLGKTAVKKVILKSQPGAAAKEAVEILIKAFEA